MFPNQHVDNVSFDAANSAVQAPGQSGSYGAAYILGTPMPNAAMLPGQGLVDAAQGVVSPAQQQVQVQVQMQAQQQPQWVVFQTPAAPGPQHPPASVAIVCDAMEDLQTVTGTVMPLTALYTAPQYVHVPLAQQAASNQPVPLASMQYVAPHRQYMQAMHMQHPLRSNTQQYSQALWSDVPGVPQGSRSVGAISSRHLRMHSAGGLVTTGPTVEDILHVVRHLPRGASVIDAVRHSLKYLDSRAVAALLKELSKTCFSAAAFQIFNWLREPQQSMDPGYGLLLDVFTYTTMIAQCTHPMHLHTALALMEEMRSRNIQPNTHTYSSLLNVCVKAGQLNMALDVYQEMLSNGLQPNLVTYNTLLDVYAKQAMWQEAIGVLDTLDQQGLVPEPRTFNIIMNTCNAAVRYLECISVHKRMLRQNVPCSVGTYNAVLLAYCKLDQLASAQQVFQEMQAKGCHPTHATFIMLLQTAEAHGQADIAVALLAQMQHMQLCVTPQCYAAAIGACAGAGQLSAARKLLAELMSGSKAGTAAPAHIIMQLQDKCCDWAAVFGTYQKLAASGVRPDMQTTATAIDAMWGAGHMGSCLLAFKVFHTACTQGLFKAEATVCANKPDVEISVPGAGTCMTIVGLWTLLVEVRAKLLLEGSSFLYQQVILLLGDGRRQMPQLQVALSQLCSARGVPFSVDNASNSLVVLTVPSADLVSWLLGPGYTDVCPWVPDVNTLESLHLDLLLSAERVDMAHVQLKISQCMDSEGNYITAGKELPAPYISQRPRLFAQLQSACNQLGPAVPSLPFTTLFLLDQAAASGVLAAPQAFSQGALSSTWVAAAVQVASQALHTSTTADLAGGTLVNGSTATVVGLPMPVPAGSSQLSDVLVSAYFGVSLDALHAPVAALKEACGDACVSPVTPALMLDLYVEVLAAGRMDHQVAVSSLVGGAHALLARAAVHPVSLEFPASHVAAALLVEGRRAAGLYPIWPKCLVMVTGLLDPQDSACAQQLSTGIAAKGNAS